MTAHDRKRLLAVAAAGCFFWLGGGFASADIGLRPAEILLAQANEDAIPMGQDDGAETKPPETAAEEPTAPSTQPSETPWPPGLLMKGFDAVGVGDAMKELGLRAYGYVEVGFTGILLGPGSSRKGLPLRVFDARKPDNLRLNQLKFTLDRPVDTSKTFDLGGRGDFLYGTDSRLIHSYGLLDKQRHDIQPDLEQAYAEMWIRTGAPGQGLDVIFGKWVTPIGAEVIDAPGNLLYSRSLLFGFAIPFTHTGVKATYYFDPGNSIYFAAVRGWDVFKDNNEGASWMGGFFISSKEQIGPNPRSTLALNFIAGPEQFSTPTRSGHTVWHDNPGNRYVLDAIWTYRFTEKLTQIINGDFGYEDGVPGALNSNGVARKRDADWYGLAYYLNYVFNDYVSATGRAEWFRDHRGVRTGFQGDFFEVTTGITLIPFPKDPCLKDLMIRPEVRWDWSANNAPLADECQMTAAVDVIYKF